MIRHSNYLFILPLSSYPLLSSFCFFNLILGVFFSLKFRVMFFLFSAIFSVFASLCWWISYSYSFFEEGGGSSMLIEGVKFSFTLFIFSEIFFFFSFFWSYFHFFLSPLIDLYFSWPPYSLLIFCSMEVPLLNTLILLSSGISITASHFFFIKGSIRLVSTYLFATFILGFIFSYFQFLEYRRSFFSINDRCFGSCFFILTGFHGIHVIIGSFYLAYSWLRLKVFDFSKDNITLSFELSSWYWHFVDVVWVFLYFFVYVYLTN